MLRKYLRIATPFLSVAALIGTGTALAAEPAKRTIIGYGSELTVRPGESIDFMVNVMGAGEYQADLVRIINGDFISRYASQFKIEEIDSAIAGSYQGMEQKLNLGSYVNIESSRTLDKLDSFTVAAWIYPTFDPAEYEEPDLENPDPFYPPTLDIAKTIGIQTIASRFDSVTGTGWSLRLNSKFQLEFVASNNGKLHTLTTAETARDWDWSYVAATYDAETETATLMLLEKPYAPGDEFTARKIILNGEFPGVDQEGPVRIAAARGGPGAAMARHEKPVDVFNGRIQDVRIAKKALSVEEVDQLSAEVAPKSLSRALVADWDFAKGIKTAVITDVRGNHDGELLNVAERGVRGRFWSGDSIVWMTAPDDYDAITFHADDLYDAEWNVDFSYTVPNGLKSGIYAARLIRDAASTTEYIVFFVAPKKGKPTNKLALWISDYNYLAYNNISIGATAAKNYPGHWWNDADNEFMKNNREYVGAGVYNKHVDGLYYSYGTRLRPDLQMKPSGVAIYNFSQDTHITAFLDHEGIDYDIITDELVDEEGLELLSQYTAVLSSTHHEYVTGEQFDALGEYTRQGGRFFYMGGNGFFWAADTNPAFPAALESRNFHHIADRYLTSGVRGGLMAETGRPSGPILGLELSGMIFNGSSPFRKLPAAADNRASWIFAGTGEGDVFGDYGIDKVHGGAVGFEVDRFNPGNGVPRHALQLATSEPLREKVEDVKILDTLPLDINYHPTSGDVWAQADLMFFETPNGGAVFSTGSITWISSTLDNNFDNDVAKITGNVIRRFLDPTPFPAIAPAAAADVDRRPANPEYEHSDQQ